MTALQFDSQATDRMLDGGEVIVDANGLPPSPHRRAAACRAESRLWSALSQVSATAIAQTPRRNRAFGFWARILQPVTIGSGSVLVCHLVHLTSPAAEVGSLDAAAVLA